MLRRQDLQPLSRVPAPPILLPRASLVEGQGGTVRPSYLSASSWNHQIRPQVSNPVCRGGLVNWASLGTPFLRSAYDHPFFPEAALTIARMPERIAWGRSDQAATMAARSSSILQVSVGKWWAMLGVGCRKSFVD